MIGRLGFAFFVCCLLYAAAAAVAVGTGISHVPTEAHRAAVFVEFAAPAVAAAVLLLLSVSVPDLMEPHRFAFPINVTSPLVYCALAYAVVTLITGAGAGIQKTPEVLQPALVWLDWRLLALTCAGQMGILTLGVVVRGRLALMAAGRQ